VRVTFEDQNRIELEGTPQGRGMRFGIAIALALVAGGSGFAILISRHSKSNVELLGVGLFIAFGLFLLAAILWLSLRRERLELDRRAGIGFHIQRHLISRRTTSTEFELSRVHAVAVERTEQASGGGRGFPITVHRARLLLLKPHAAIDLDEIQGGDPSSVEAIASRLARFLNVPVVRLTGKRPRRRGRGKPEASSGAVMEPEAPDTPHAGDGRA